MSLTFRPATRSDITPLLALIQSAYRGPSSRAGWTTEADLLEGDRISPATLDAKITHPSDIILLAYSSDQELVACCELVHRDDERAYFGLFAVTPPLQAAGIGRQVLQRAEEYAVKQWGTKTMEMCVIWTREELIAWYVRRGYRLTGDKKPFPYEELEKGMPLRHDLYFDVLEKEL
ncbi:hypothetical protein FZEAL_3967 [Fusarium zealandicum]|uniref:N-acetyltransferase domain-containing protein n=1 Tax=Fusarium zealandicum TaxID=1053134 RepID=A0A8H4XMD8_9HYPO|nr:hypothetical protein FZEAL_3967 [Fusarium zealandicum]